MSYQKESFGMMDEGYFVPRTQIIDWINNLLQLDLTKIEQLGSGAVYCQLVDVIHPGKVAMSKVNWKAKNDYEFISNLKILQTAFDKAGVKRYVQVEKLAKAKYQDNLEFIQWLKRYYDLNCGDRGSSYNAKQRRGGTKVDMGFAEKNVVPKSFNGGGQITPKVEVPGKKTTQVLSNKSSVIPESKPQTKNRVQRKVQAPVRKQQKRTSVASTANKTKNWQKLYNQEAQKNKQLSMKIAMIQQIVKSQDDSSMKLNMLVQVLGVAQQKVKQVKEESTQQQPEQEAQVEPQQEGQQAF